MDATAVNEVGGPKRNLVLQLDRMFDDDLEILTDLAAVISHF